MEIAGKIVIVTGGAEGIGRALCRRFAREGAKAVVVADINGEKARETAAEINGLAVETDVSDRQSVKDLVHETLDRFGAVDLFCSNAGIFIPGGLEVPDEEWNRILSINFKAHLYAAQAAVPAMISQGGGYLLQTVSAAGLLTQIGSAPYSVTKHAALAFAEWLSVTYGDHGVKVSCLCPQGVRTRMLEGDGSGHGNFLTAGAIEPDEVAEAAVQGLAEERFLILPHPEVAEYVRRRADDRDRWLRGMRRLQAAVDNAGS